ncbi:MAG: hypothetical protein B7Z66_07490 [Chromatiales bacterium 21-64-14]|nr:MAG: hypothetical protein B7Z66_07490 [Chromatiales bacterium 21-64-14]HQU15424.1 hypothetical protein [Gammaproteobacteria bacterium]
MNVEKQPEDTIRLTFEISEGDALAGALSEHADAVSSAALNLSSILRAARYNAKNSFRQPPDPWSPGVRHPSYR